MSWIYGSHLKLKLNVFIFKVLKFLIFKDFKAKVKTFGFKVIFTEK